MVFLMQKSGVVYSFEHNVPRIFAKEFFLNFLVLTHSSLINLLNHSVVTLGYIGIGQNCGIGTPFSVVFKLRKYITNAFQTGFFFVISFNNDPWTERGVCFAKHLLFIGCV